MKKILSIFCLVLSLVFCQSAYSTYTCNGKVANITVSPNGILTLSYANFNAVYVCSVNTLYNGVQQDACKSILSLLMAAKMADRDVGFWFNDASNDCTVASHPAWADLKNWYFGPMLY